jgi:diphthamide biosynthesis methyltransferase
MLFFIGLGLCDEKDITVRSADSRLHINVMSRVRLCSMQTLHHCLSTLARNPVHRGLEAVRGSQRIYLEAYTSQLLVPTEQLVSRSCRLLACLAACCWQHAAEGGDRSVAAQEEYYGKSIIVADREMVESQSDDILDGAKDEDVSFLVVGDPFGWASLAILTSQPCALQGDPGTVLSLRAGCHT